ncbi:MAG: ABC transporter permease [Spirochaetaceae bacterium]|jgi:peptide/nickel transport system permease protein|nr:ABC transporter permease [Spirochaetaceae bacterium]
MKMALDYRDVLARNLKWKREHRNRALQKFLSDANLSAGAIIFLLVVLLALFGPLLIHGDPYAMTVTERLKAPGGPYFLGTDEFGRDLLTRIIYGARISIGIGAAVTLLASILGLAIGVYASYYPILDHIFMRICDGMSAIPGILLAIALMAVLGASARNVVIALAIVYVPGVARVVRSAALVVREAPFIEALKTQGAGDLRIIWLHIIPNVLSPLFVQASFVFAGALLSEASLSFLGAGIPAPAPSWGNILQAGKGVIHKAWWMVVFPGCMIVLSVLSLTMLGDGLRDFLDPRTGDSVK